MKSIGKLNSMLFDAAAPLGWLVRKAPERKRANTVSGCGVK